MTSNERIKTYGNPTLEYATRFRTVNSQFADPETVLQFRFHISDHDVADKPVKTLSWNNASECELYSDYMEQRRLMFL